MLEHGPVWGLLLLLRLKLANRLKLFLRAEEPNIRSLRICGELSAVLNRLPLKSRPDAREPQALSPHFYSQRNYLLAD